jgi:hypothetical protein
MNDIFKPDELKAHDPDAFFADDLSALPAVSPDQCGILIRIDNEPAAGCLTASVYLAQGNPSDREFLAKTYNRSWLESKALKVNLVNCDELAPRFKGLQMTHVDYAKDRGAHQVNFSIRLEKYQPFFYFISIDRTKPLSEVISLINTIKSSDEYLFCIVSKEDPSYRPIVLFDINHDEKGVMGITVKDKEIESLAKKHDCLYVKDLMQLDEKNIVATLANELATGKKKSFFRSKLKAFEESKTKAPLPLPSSPPLPSPQALGLFPAPPPQPSRSFIQVVSDGVSNLFSFSKPQF